MTFGALPFLLAGLAAAIPVVLHMINRNKAKDLPFPTLRFLRLSVEKTRRRKRIHDIFLLLVRMAVLILIAIGLAKPTVTNLSSLWGGDDLAVAIILDNSTSMGTIDQGRVRFRTALRAAEQIMDQLDDGDQVALLITGGPKYDDEGKLHRKHENVLQILGQWVNSPSDTHGVTYQQADLTMKVRQAEKLLREAKATDRQIYVLTDQQKLSWPGLENEEEKTTDKKSDKAVEIPIVIVDCNRAPKPNVALTDVQVNAMVPIAGQPIIAAVELLNTSSVAQQRHVALFVDGQEKYTSPALNIPPGERIKHEITFTFERGGLHRGEVHLTGKDGSAMDDRRFFTMEVDQGIPVAIVKQQQHEIPYLEDTFYLQRALAPGKSGGWAIRTDSLTAAELANATLAEYKVVFCVNLTALPQSTAGRLRDYVAGGGNVVWICGDNVQPQAYQEMNESVGGQLLPAGLLDAHVPDPALGRDSWNIGFLDPQHPALAPLLEPASLYRDVLIYKHIRLDAGSGENVRVLARLDDQQGEPLLVQRDVQQGKVLMLGTGAHIGWSNLPLRPIFLPLLAGLVFDLANVEQERFETLAGSPLVLPREESAGPMNVEVIVPTGETIRPEGQPSANEPFRYADTQEIGIYELKLLPPSRPRQLAYAVNADADEFDPATVDREALEKHFAPMPMVFAEDPDDLTSTFKWLREGKSLWGLFLTAVLIALIFETFLSNRLSPKPEQTENQPPPGMRRLAKKTRGAA